MNLWLSHTTKYGKVENSNSSLLCVEYIYRSPFKYSNWFGRFGWRCWRGHVLQKVSIFVCWWNRNQRTNKQTKPTVWHETAQLKSQINLLLFQSKMTQINNNNGVKRFTKSCLIQITNTKKLIRWSFFQWEVQIHHQTQTQTKPPVHSPLPSCLLSAARPRCTYGDLFPFLAPMN